MQRIPIILFFCAALSLHGMAQKHTISGYVSEKGSRELLIGVNIYIPGTQTGTVTNNYGFYSMTLPDGEYQIRYSFVGYNTITQDIKLDKDIELNIHLESTLMLEGVTVVAEEMEKVSEEPQMSIVSVPIRQVGEIPAFLGEKDVFKVLQLMPGVQKGTEGSSGLYVRGGGPDQNLIILDDATVYNANHLFGFFSVFNGDALKSVELTKGGFPARFGGRLSSVVEMNMKDGNKEKLSGNGGIGIISSRLTLEGPIVPAKSSFLISGRRTYLDILTQPIFAAQQMSFGYYFYDLNAKVNYDFGRKNKLYASGYFGRDKFYIVDKSGGLGEKFEAGLYWQNQTGTLRWNHLFTNKLFANTSFIFSNYVLKTYVQDYINQNDFFYVDYHSGIRDFSGKIDLSYNPTPNHYIRMGIQSIQHRFTPGALVIKNSVVDADTIISKVYDSFENGIYIEDEFKVGQRLKVNAGFRLSHFVNVEKHYIYPEPRFSGSYLIKPRFSFKASFATMNQYVHLLSPTGVGLPTDLWVPATDRIPPQQSSQVAAGFAKDFDQQGLAVTLEGYYKKSKRIIGYKEGATFLLIDDPTGAESFTWQDNITGGQAWSYGTEFLIQKKTGMLSGWIGYTLSWTQFQFDELNYGGKFWARYDRRHDVSVVAIYKPNPRVTMSMTWVYGTGNAVTLPLGQYYALPHQPGIFGQEDPPEWYAQYVQDFGAKNSFRMAPYHRLDLSVQVKVPHDKWEGSWEFSIYNVYSRRNPFFYFVDSDFVNGQYQQVLKQVSLFPIIPSISYNFNF